ncbi:NAD(P)-binding protein [Parafrigoribacterium mesophilum]|uniref:NAD(P)-binding protein n=1 Tax=Parafrigoribacterium mesophilum TaxID=433646 RepID=UPI0031FCA785
MPGVVDYLIVGAGSSGSVLAARLSSRADASVLLLEAGAARCSAAPPPSTR